VERITTTTVRKYDWILQNYCAGKRFHNKFIIIHDTTRNNKETALFGIFLYLKAGLLHHPTPYCFDLHVATPLLHTIRSANLWVTKERCYLGLQFDLPNFRLPRNGTVLFTLARDQLFEIIGIELQPTVSHILQWSVKGTVSPD
jgi:hypothetical protein